MQSSSFNAGFHHRTEGSLISISGLSIQKSIALCVTPEGVVKSLERIVNPRDERAVETVGERFIQCLNSH